MPSLSASAICKILAFFLLLCMTKASGGTCLSYGHSCWGGFLNVQEKCRTKSPFILKNFRPFTKRRVDLPFGGLSSHRSFFAVYTCCWHPFTINGHGKRNSIHHLAVPSFQKRNGEWFISRLLNPSFESTKKSGSLQRTKSGQSDDFDKLRQYENQIFSAADLKENNFRDETGDGETDLKSFKLETDGNESEEDVVVLAPEIQKIPITNYKFFRIMDQEDEKKKLRNLQN